MELIGKLSSRFQSKKQVDNEGSQTYGAFFGVFLPSALAMFGVIMYLRLGVLLGKMGLVPTLSLVLLSGLITLIASFSISSIATNMVVNKGGAYYIISRSLGIDFGAAIGIPLYLAQTIGIAFYVIGFSEVFCALYPSYDPRTLSLGVLLLLGLLGFFSTSSALKMQLVIFLLILASLGSIIFGEGVVFEGKRGLFSGHQMGYWAAFAIFFPAVTGIESGLSMSGNLKNASRSLPIGTIYAVCAGLVLYVGLTCLLWWRVPRDLLAENSLILTQIARWGGLVILGIFGATLSSALGAILGAPRTLQALAEDGVLPNFLSKEYGKQSEPRIATLFTLGLAALFIFMGNIDLIAPILTMFFLISYCMLNLVAGLEALMGNPSWRPTFVTPPLVSFSGAALCLVVMLMINSGATLASLLFVLIIYAVRGRKLSANWDDMCFGILMFFTKTTIHRLKTSGYSARSWRPHLLVITQGLTPPGYYVNFSSKLTRGKSFVTFSNVIEESSPYNQDAIKKAVSTALKKYKFQAFVEVDKVENRLESYRRLILAHGIGSVNHNTIVLDHTSSNGSAYELNPELIQYAFKAGKNALILSAEQSEDTSEKSIDIWWDSEHRSTSELILVLASMYQTSLGVKKAKITLKSLVSSETAREGRAQYFKDLFSKSRLTMDYKVYVAAEDEELKMIQHFSQEADLVFVGLPEPTAEEDYQKVYGEHMKSLKGLNKVVLALAAEPVNFEEIFR